MGGSKLGKVALAAGFLAALLLILGDGAMGGSSGHATDVVVGAMTGANTTVVASAVTSPTLRATSTTSTTTALVDSVLAPPSLPPRATPGTSGTAAEIPATTTARVSAATSSQPPPDLSSPDTTDLSVPSTSVTTSPSRFSTTVTTAPPGPAVATPGAAACANGTYINTAGDEVCRPFASDVPPVGATARCRDGEYSFSESKQGTCSSHGGVANWL
jgi:hypothetical protein